MYSAIVGQPRTLEKLPLKANLKPVEVAAFLDFSPATVYYLIHAGTIPAVKLRRQYRIPREKFVAAFEAHAFQPDF